LDDVDDNDCTFVYLTLSLCQAAYVSHASVIAVLTPAQRPSGAATTPRSGLSQNRLVRTDARMQTLDVFLTPQRVPLQHRPSSFRSNVLTVGHPWMTRQTQQGPSPQRQPPPEPQSVSSAAASQRPRRFRSVLRAHSVNVEHVADLAGLFHDNRTYRPSMLTSVRNLLERVDEQGHEGALERFLCASSFHHPCLSRVVLVAVVKAWPSC
jgi:hypothetical protein